jgi:hypothetical protein
MNLVDDGQNPKVWFIMAVTFFFSIEHNRACVTKMNGER